MLTKTYLGLNPDGTPHFHYHEDDPTQALVITGKVYGEVTLPDGSLVEVSDSVISVPAEQKNDVSDAIGLRHIELGHPDFVNDPNADPFGYVHVGQDGVPVVSANAAPETIEAITAVLGIEPVQIGA
jgi:hypothetical protein